MPYHLALVLIVREFLLDLTVRYNISGGQKSFTTHSERGVYFSF